MSAMRRLAPLALALAFAASVFARPAAAWLAPGHMATGALAYDDLARGDLRALATVLRLMSAHPDRGRFDAELSSLPTGPPRDRRLFELMARWPDDVRRTPYDRDAWHYSQKIVSPIRWLFPPAFGQAEPAFRRELRLARDPKAAPGDRAVALCWVFHIVGDMHQPLHAALWMDARFPFTDQGGNTAWVRRSPEAPPEKLHWFWDSAARPGGSRRESPVELETEVIAAADALPEPAPKEAARAFDGWVRRSREIAREDVYLRGGLRPGVDPQAAPVLTAEYVARTRQVTTTQLALAGHRIAALLRDLR